jgi:hypothetical protein
LEGAVGPGGSLLSLHRLHDSGSCAGTIECMRRRPPFALVLVALVAALGGAFARLSGGGSPKSTPTPSTPTQASASACVTARAQAQATARQTLWAPVTVTVPVSVTERAAVRQTTVSATLSENVVERATGTRTIEVHRVVVASRRACARGTTSDAARGAALNRAYSQALAAAKLGAEAAAEKALAAHAAQQLPALQAQTRAQLESAASTAAAAARQTLAQQALAKARASGH